MIKSCQKINLEIVDKFSVSRDVIFVEDSFPYASSLAHTNEVQEPKFSSKFNFGEIRPIGPWPTDRGVLQGLPQLLFDLPQWTQLNRLLKQLTPLLGWSLLNSLCRLHHHPLRKQHHQPRHQLTPHQLRGSNFLGQTLPWVALLLSFWMVGLLPQMEITWTALPQPKQIWIR